MKYYARNPNGNPVRRICKNCRHYADVYDGSGECRITNPQSYVIEVTKRMGSTTDWPAAISINKVPHSVRADYWCGNWELPDPNWVVYE